MPEQSELTILEQQNELVKNGGAKFKKWCQYFLDPKSETYGNATKSALRAYKTKKYHNAGAIGSENYKKLKNVGMHFYENAGKSQEYWFNLLAEKAAAGSYEQMADFMERFGMIDKAATPDTNNFFNLGSIAATFQQERKQRGLVIDAEEADSK